MGQLNNFEILRVVSTLVILLRSNYLASPRLLGKADSTNSSLVDCYRLKSNY